MRKQFIIFLILIFVLGLVPINFSNAENLTGKLKGRILLQVESSGEAWYVNPDTNKRAYLGRPEDAFSVMRELGLGISNKDFNLFNGYAPKRLSGKILLKVEDAGKAYYVNPIDLKMHFLGKPADAFKVMRELGLGISNNDLSKIKENFQSSTSQITKPTPIQKKVATTSNSKIATSIKYISDNTVLYSLTVDQSGITNLAHIKTLYRGTQITFMSVVYKDWSKIMVNNQEGWVFSSSLVDDEPLTPKLSTIIKKWRPIVAYVECDFRDTNTQELYSQVRGSGVVIDLDTQITIITNKHIIVDSNGFQAYSCSIKLPNDSSTFVGQKFTGGGLIDIGFIDINNPNEYIKNLTSISTSPLNFCKEKPSLGDDVLILGYPSIGSQTDITATEGIISGYDGNYFVTSAKIEQGNSGGAAILVKSDCYLGIPSFAKAGNIESLSRILDINVVQNINNITSKNVNNEIPGNDNTQSKPQNNTNCEKLKNDFINFARQYVSTYGLLNNVVKYNSEECLSSYGYSILSAKSDILLEKIDNLTKAVSNLPYISSDANIIKAVSEIKKKFLEIANLELEIFKLKLDESELNQQDQSNLSVLKQKLEVAKKIKELLENNKQNSSSLDSSFESLVETNNNILFNKGCAKVDLNKI